MSSSPHRFRSWAHVHLGHLEYNLAAIRRALPPYLRYISVVKADAYGHGLEPIVARLMHSRADAFAVANLDEAARLRSVGSGWTILVLSSLLPAEVADAVHLGVCPVISSFDELRALSSHAAKARTTVDIHLKIDTGMGRLGVWHEYAKDLLVACSSTPHIRLRGLCTHFACADSDPAFTLTQRSRFYQCISSLPTTPQLWIHADNSAGIDTFPANGPFNAARIGLLQFGVPPAASGSSLLGDLPVRPVLSFHCRIALIKSLPAGSTVSYGATHQLKRRSRIAVLSAGYADGVPLALGNRGSVIIHQQLCPIIGRVTMDQTVVDVTDLQPPPAVGDVATFIGSKGKLNLDLWSVARSARSIPWDLLCSLSSRTKRVYSMDSAS
jgi:alanine racemase